MADRHSQLTAIPAPAQGTDLLWAERGDVPYKLTIQQILDLGGGGVTDHGALTGLGDDDHTQYSLVTGARAFTGSVTVGQNADAATREVIINAAAGQNRQVRWQTGGVTRWQWRVGTGAESGSDAGSGINLEAYSDAGTLIDAPLIIARAAGGNITLARHLAMMASTTSKASWNAAHGTAPSSPVNGDFWTTTAGLFGRINGSTAQFATGGGTATGTNTGDQTITLTGDVTGSGTGSFATTLTAASVLSKLLTVDGAGSGLDADLLDTYEATAFPRKAENATVSGLWTFDGNYIQIDGAAPRLYLNETDQAANDKLWAVRVNSKIFDIALFDDAKSAAVSVIQFTRGTGNVLSSVTIGNSTDQATVSVNGSLSAGVTGTASRTLTIGNNAMTGSPVMVLNSATGVERRISWQTAGSSRWQLGTDNGTESGSSAGSGFFLRALDDAASTIDTPLTIVRAAGGAMTLTRPLVMATGSSSIPSWRSPHGAAPSSPTNGDFWTTTRGLYGRVNGYDTGFVPKRLFTNAGAPNSAGPTRFEVEDGGYSENGSPNTGAIKIALPVSWTDQMMWLRIRGYDYNAAGSTGNGAWEIIVGGYNYAGGTAWYNTSAHITGGRPRFSTVKFGHDGSKCVIQLGVTTDAHQYPKVEVVECSVGYSAATTYDLSTGWAVSRITAETGITYSGTTATLYPGTVDAVASTAAWRDSANWIYAQDFSAQGGWHRNNTSGTGLYNSAHANHFYADSANYWNITFGGQSAGGLRMRTDHAGTIRGYLYGDSSGSGILNDSGNWAVRGLQGGANAGGYLYGNWLQTGGTAFNIDSSGTSCELQMRTSGSVMRGYVYADNNNYIGFLNNAGAWSLRGDSSKNWYSYGLVSAGYGCGSADASMEIGTSRGANGYAYLDFVGDTTYTDYGLRIIRNNGGANTSTVIVTRGTGVFDIYTNEAGDLRFGSSATIRMTVQSDGYIKYAAAGDTSYEIGYRDLPQNVQNATYTFAYSDRGKSVGKTNNTAYTYTVPPNSTTAFPVGTVITVFNYGSSGNISIAQGSGVTIQKGTATGTRTLGPYGVCTILKVSTDVWFISGSELS